MAFKERTLFSPSFQGAKRREEEVKKRKGAQGEGALDIICELCLWDYAKKVIQLLQRLLLLKVIKFFFFLNYFVFHQLDVVQ